MFGNYVLALSLPLLLSVPSELHVAQIAQAVSPCYEYSELTLGFVPSADDYEPGVYGPACPAPH